MSKVKIGLIGTGFVGDIHAAALKMAPDAELVAVASLPEGKPKEFAEARGIPKAFEDYKDLLALEEVDLVHICAPNHLHCQMAVDAASAGKHVVCEKPLCRNLAQADAMIDACREAKVLLMYAEELCFAPKYVRAKRLVDEGALGKPFLVKQSEEHDGPHMPWFWDVEKSGGGVLLDMGCHSIEFARWVFGKPEVGSVYANLGIYVHADKTRGEDHSLCIVEYEGNRVGFAENSWAKRGGVDDRCEIYGSAGFTRRSFAREFAPHLQPERLRLRGRKSGHDQRLHLYHVRGDLELRLPAGDAALRPLCERRGETGRDRRGRSRGAQDHPRRLPVGGKRRASRVALRTSPGR